MRDVADKEDIILDIDNIWQMITINERYVKPKKISSNVFMIRDCIMDMIKCRTGNWNNAFVIGGYPNKSDRERTMDILGAKDIFISEKRSICLKRAIECRGNEYIEYINDWFELYEATSDPPLLCS